METASGRRGAWPDVAGWPGHRAGQHVDVRLTAADGYQAQRTYSIASPPGAHILELTVVPSLTTVSGSPARAARDVGYWGTSSSCEARLAGEFVWDGDDTTPVLLVGGGSGVVPLIAMMRHHARLASTTPMRFIYSARSLDDVIRRSELDEHWRTAAIATPPSR